LSCPLRPLLRSPVCVLPEALVNSRARGCDLTGTSMHTRRPAVKTEAAYHAGAGLPLRRRHFFAHSPMALLVSTRITWVGVSPVLVPIWVCEFDHMTSPCLNCRCNTLPSGKVMDRLKGDSA